MIVAITLITAYILFTLFVAWRINNSFYFDEERRRLHKRLIWLAPLIGPILIFSFWTKTKRKSETMTKDKRERKKGDFYESGIGLDA